MFKAPPEALRSRPCVLSIPAGVPFLECLADALLDGGLLPDLAPLRSDPLALSDARIFLPTRRAVRELEAIFTAQLGGAAVLPRISALGDFAEDEDAFDPAPDYGTEELPDAIGETERRLALAVLIRGWAKSVARAISGSGADLISTTPSEAISLAIELGALIDSFETEGAKWTELAPLIPPEHDTVWQITAEFLDVAATAWPAFLAERGEIGGAARRNLQLRALADRFRRNVPASPVIVAGSTGSNPATADLMEAVGRLPNGAIVLQGLDVAADNEAWAEIGGDDAKGFAAPQAWTHPQHSFHRLLKKLDVRRDEIRLLGREELESKEGARDQRRALVSTALLPSDLTDRWAAQRAKADTALDGLMLIEAANEREEALAIALTLVDALRVPDKTAALITPDRPLARRVAAELRRWGVEAEDSAGLPLADSEAGILARLVAEAARENLAPQALLPLLRHPDARFGMDSATRHRAADAIEIGVLRGPAPPPGAAGLSAAVKLARNPPVAGEKRYWHPAKRRLGPPDWDAADALIGEIAHALGSLCALGKGGGEVPLGDLLTAHRLALLAVTAGSEADPNRVEIETFFTEALAGGAQINARLADYPAIFKALLRGKTARAARPSHPRLRILGTLEARLLGFDRVVLGGLNETIWPAQTKNDAFLSRPMRGALGLPPPEWRVGLSAHDFEQALGGSDVVLTRALKAGGAPSVSARWLQRLAAVAGKTDWDKVAARGTAFLGMARALDEAEMQRLEAPAPKPKREKRPGRLSVTEIETLIRDPYAIYAKHVLELAPLDPLGAEPGASDRGNIVHDALAAFVEKHDPFAPDALDQLRALGRAGFDPYWIYPDVRAVWWPRFEKIAAWFVTWERERRTTLAAILTERRGALEWKTGAGRDFKLAGRADRLDEMRDGTFTIVDYKTGRVPGHGEVQTGLAPQLPLEAAMLAEGAFEHTASGTTSSFLYVQLSGRDGGGQPVPVKLDDKSASEIAARALGDLKGMIDRFENEDEPYRPGTHPKFRRRPNGDYDHLARFAEWLLAPDAPENGE